MTRIAFAGNRKVAARCLQVLLDAGAHPEALIVMQDPSADELRAMADLPGDRVLVGRAFREQPGIDLLASLDLDYVIGVHYPMIVPEAVLEIPRIGVTNLHPALLPYNRGWHTPSWAILDGTPIGATLHFMDSGLDTGDIIAQAAMEVRPDDTAHTLYGRLLDLEVELFRDAWPLLASGHPPRRPQDLEAGTRHDRADLASDTVRRLDLDAAEPVGDLVRRLRALTTNNPDEAAYFEVGGRRFRVQVDITPEEG